MRRTHSVALLAALALLPLSCSESMGLSNAPSGKGLLGPDDQAALERLRASFDVDPDAVQHALLDPTYDGTLRDSLAFRELIDWGVIRHGICRLSFVGPDEEGERIVLQGIVKGADGKSIEGAVVRIFATDAQGHYHPVIEGERVPRIFGTVVSDASGRFEATIVRPGPYPGTRQARHVHVSASAGSLRLSSPGYMVFDDDPLLHEPQNAEQRSEAIVIRMSRAEDRAVGTFELPLR